MAEVFMLGRWISQDNIFPSLSWESLRSTTLLLVCCNTNIREHRYIAQPASQPTLGLVAEVSSM